VEFKFKPIGIIHSPFTRNEDIDARKFSDPQGFDQIQGKLEIFKEYKRGLKDTEGFSHVMVIYVFHKSRGYKLHTKPFLDDQLRGLFSTRSPHRPNPLGLTVVRVLGREGNILKVSGIDMLEGTPILDIKPYTSRDRKSPLRLGWLGNKMKRFCDYSGVVLTVFLFIKKAGIIRFLENQPDKEEICYHNCPLILAR
jgi:tRNA-Thr(GGU) m(6)t(6)A37 methyltransferase TsaA